MAKDGWIKLHRSTLDWEWYNSNKHCRLFFHLLLLANHKETKWRGMTIKEGQILTGLIQLSQQTGLGVQSIRTVLRDLISTGEITRKTYNQFSIITITNWKSYQISNNPPNKQPTSDQQATTYKKGKKE